MNVLAVAFSSNALNRKILLEFFDTRIEIKNWLAVYESLILVITDLTAGSLQDIIHEKFPNLSFIIFPAISNLTNGRETPNVWDFINNPKSSGYWKDKDHNLLNTSFWQENKK